MKKTIRFLITGVGGQGTILASDILAEVGLRLGHDAKKSDILGLAVRGGSVVSHIIWGENVRAPMIDRGTADYYLSFEWLEGLRRLVYTNKDTVVLANDWRIDPVSVSSGRPTIPTRTASAPPSANAARACGNPGHAARRGDGQRPRVQQRHDGRAGPARRGRRRRLALRHRRPGRAQSAGSQCPGIRCRAEPHVLGPSHLETAFAARGCGVP